MKGSKHLDDNPFGLTIAPFGPSVVVLDKSFLDGASFVQLQHHSKQGITFAVTEVLLYELMRKSNDAQRRTSLFKLSEIKNLIQVPSIGEMLRAEGRYREPAPRRLTAFPVKISPRENQLGNPFPMTLSERLTTETRTLNFQNERIPETITLWRSLSLLPSVKGVSAAELVDKLAILKREIRDDIGSIRQFFSRIRRPIHPPSNVIDGRWATFRWLQVNLLAGLDFYHRHGTNSQPNREKLMHEMLDLDYTITSILVGGLATCEKRIIERFRFLRPTGKILRGPL